MKDLITSIFKENLGLEIKDISPIKTAITNNVFLVDNNYVIRLKNLGDQFYNVENEKFIDSLMNKEDLTAPTLYFDNVAGNKITKYIKSSTMEEGKPTDFEILQAAKIIKKMHELPKKSVQKFDLFKRLETYQINKISMIDTDFEKHVIRYIKFYHFLEEKVVCHNDLVNGNILYDQDKTYLIDFEYSGRNNRYFDLASFISENNITNEAQIEVFLLAYFEDKEFINWKHFDYFVFFNDILWYNWANYYYEMKKEKIYEEIRDLKFQRIQNDILKYRRLYKHHKD